MQRITPQLTAELSRHNGSRDVWRAPAFRVEDYRRLVEHVARLSYLNRTLLAFFRGQGSDYQSKAEGSTLYPAIYRGDNLAPAELDVRFRKLDSASRALVKLFRRDGIEGAHDVSRKRYVQWSILQHYQIVPTPLLDITHSLRVACSFAQLAATDSTCYVYVLGFPYSTNRISINSEEDLVNIRLLSICPPQALRPFFQEGYMAGTPDVTSNFDTKTELDFRNRLVAKFAIPSGKKFWNDGSSGTPKTALYPSSDEVLELCQEVITEINEEVAASGEAGQLLVEWGKLEEQFVPRVRQIKESNASAREAIEVLAKLRLIDKQTARDLNQVRHVRNVAAHRPRDLKEAELEPALRKLELLKERVSQIRWPSR